MKLQVNVTRAESKTVCTHLRTSSAILKYEIPPTPDIISLSCRQNLVEDLPPLRNFLTHISTWPAATRVLSRMKREREPWEKGCLTASYSSFFKNGSTKSTTRSSQRNRRSICAVESWSCCKCTSCTSLSDGCHFLFVNCVLKCRLDHT